MSPITIASVVEGHGEVQALPTLLRVAGELYGRWDVATPPPHRVKRNQMTSQDTLSRAARTQAARVTGGGGVIVLVDADDDCAVELAGQLRAAGEPVRVEVAVAVREFEAWFLAAATSLRKHPKVAKSETFDGDPEARRGAKELLGTLMTEPYRETLHQVAFCAVIDLDEAMKARSFRHFVSCVGRLVGESV